RRPRQDAARPADAVVGRAVIAVDSDPGSERTRARERGGRAGTERLLDLVVRAGDQNAARGVADDRVLVLLVLRELQPVILIKQVVAGNGCCRRLARSGHDRDDRHQQQQDALHVVPPRTIPRLIPERTELTRLLHRSRDFTGTVTTPGGRSSRRPVRRRSACRLSAGDLFDPGRAARGREDALVPVVPAHSNPRRVISDDLLDDAGARGLCDPLRLDHDPVSNLRPHLEPPQLGEWRRSRGYSITAAPGRPATISLTS